MARITDRVPKAPPRILHRREGESSRDYHDRRLKHAQKRIVYEEARMRHFMATDPGPTFNFEGYRYHRRKVANANNYLGKVRHERVIAYAYEKNYLPLFLS